MTEAAHPTREWLTALPIAVIVAAAVVGSLVLFVALFARPSIGWSRSGL